MFQNVTPESVGISSEEVLNVFKRLDAYDFCTHAVLMARGEHIFAETYYAPFHRDFKHRMYSVSKSFVGVAIGLCEEEGLLSLDDKFITYFEEYMDEDINENMSEMTIRDMLTMSTCIEENIKWLIAKPKDRSALYFKLNASRIPGTTYTYDSPGSYMLGVLVEKLTKKPFLEYLKDKVFCHTEFSKDAYCLKCPGGHSWGDSGVLCTARDLLILARFVMNKGVIDGVRYMNSKYLEDAVARQVDNDLSSVGLNYNGHGYGYQIWKAPDNGFAFIGMGDQLAICDPKTDFIFVINAYNHGISHARAIIYHELYNNIIPKLGQPLLENPEEHKKLMEYLENRELVSVRGKMESSWQKRIEGVTYILEENRMQIEFVRFTFEEGRGILTYRNLQGEKKLYFGLGYNEYFKFPQEGYADMIGTMPEEGHMYDCACSGAWVEENKLKINVQIIDKYFGNLPMTFGFKGRSVGIAMRPIAEGFLGEYTGFANGHA